jgi:hypothetical protein
MATFKQPTRHNPPAPNLLFPGGQGAKIAHIILQIPGFYDCGFTGNGQCDRMGKM